MKREIKFNRTIKCFAFGINKWATTGDQIDFLDDGSFNIQPDNYYKVVFKNVGFEIVEFLRNSGNSISDILYVDNVGLDKKARLKTDHGEIKVEITFGDNQHGYWGE